jgi:hypothetical protein
MAKPCILVVESDLATLKLYRGVLDEVYESLVRNSEGEQL